MVTFDKSPEEGTLKSSVERLSLFDFHMHVQLQGQVSVLYVGIKGLLCKTLGKKYLRSHYPSPSLCLCTHIKWHRRQNFVDKVYCMNLYLSTSMCVLHSVVGSLSVVPQMWLFYNLFSVIFETNHRKMPCQLNWCMHISLHTRSYKINVYNTSWSPTAAFALEPWLCPFSLGS